MLDVRLGSEYVSEMDLLVKESYLSETIKKQCMKCECERQ